MPILYEDRTARFDGICTVEEALDFAEFLRAPAPAQVDLSTCQHLHSALLQCLLAFRPVLKAPPADSFLAGCLTLLPRPAPRKRAPKKRT